MSTVKNKSVYWTLGIVVGFFVLVLFILQLFPGKQGDTSRPDRAVGRGLSVESTVDGAKDTRNEVLTAQATAGAGELGDKWLDGVRDGIEQSVYDTFHKVILDGMVLTDQPKDYTNVLIRHSPDGRFVAFYSFKDRVGRIVVVDQQTGTETILPVPDETILDERSIAHLEWGHDGHVLYVVEDAEDGVKTYQVFYAWKPGEVNVRVLGRMDGDVLSLATNGSSVRLVNRSKEKGTGYVDLREYRDDGLISLQTLHVSCNGKSIDPGESQLLYGRNELWFVASGNDGKQKWLAMMDLNDSGSEARLVVPDIHGRFTWSSDEEKLFFLKDGVNKVGKDQVNLYLLSHKALDHPVLLTSKDLPFNHVPLHFAGVSHHNGGTVYLTSLIKEKVSFDKELFANGSYQIYEYDLPK